MAGNWVQTKTWQVIGEHQLIRSMNHITKSIHTLSVTAYPNQGHGVAGAWTSHQLTAGPMRQTDLHQTSCNRRNTFHVVV